MAVPECVTQWLRCDKGVIILHEPGRIGAGGKRGTAESELTFVESAPGIFRTTFGATKEGIQHGVHLLAPAQRVGRGTAGRPSTRRPSGIRWNIIRHL
jgi:hypothetical protein